MKIPLSISPSYVPNWDTWSAIREIVQNWLDGKSAGHDGFITHNSNNNTLTLTNNGVILTRAQLGMLGETTKSDRTEMIGQWGEGGKLAALVLVREGRGISIDSGQFRYTAAIEHSEEFDKDCLTWNCRHLAKSHFDGIKVIISGISKEMWNTYKNNFLYFRTDFDKLEKNYHGNLLNRPEDKGRIYVKGIFVNRDDKLAYGYNFYNVKLDRDRKMVGDFDLTYNIGWILVNALKQNIISPTAFMELIQSGAKDTQHVSYHADSAVAELLSTEFIRIYGVNAVPVKSHEDLQKVEYFGLRGIVVPQVLFDILDRTAIGMVNALRKVGSIENNPCTINELEPEYASNVREVIELLSKSKLNLVDVDMVISVDSLTFVDFKDEKIMGTFCQGKIKISKRILGAKDELLTTLVEEIAHEKGPDGSHEHKMQIHAIYNSIIIHGLKAF